MDTEKTETTTLRVYRDDLDKIRAYVKLSGSSLTFVVSQAISAWAQNQMPILMEVLQNGCGK